jgi:soluble lytic murein transglycosylase-like protein
MQPQNAIVPGIIVGSTVLILFTKLLTSTQPAVAATQEPVQEENNNSAAETSACSLSSLPDSIRPWCGLIESAAAEYGVPADLVAAVMLQESGGQPEVISASGAVGLMQVMPSDGIAAGFMCVNGPCFASRPTTQQLLNPEFNVDYGVRMLAGLLERYGNERDALKAYGPYNVEYYYADKVLAIKGNL